jgi:hypothetical protein
LKVYNGFLTEVNPLKFYKSEKEKYYEIEVLQGVRCERYIITLACLRIENKDMITDGESEFWFNYKMDKQ